MFILRRLTQPAIRWPLIATGGLAARMILVLNLSYIATPVRHGCYLALAGSLAPLLLRPRAVLDFAKSLRSAGMVVVFILLGVSGQGWPLVKEGILTTAPAENGDWLTYVNHSDILADYGYGYVAAHSEYPQHFLYTQYYGSSNFRYGPSHLLAKQQRRRQRN